MLSSSKMQLAFCEFTFNAAEVYRANTQVRGDVMLRHPLYNVRLFCQKVQVTLLGRIAYERHKFINVMRLPLSGHF